MTENKMQYADRIAKAKKEWEDKPEAEKAQFLSGIANGVAAFLLWWDTLKAIEKKFNVEVMGIAREMRWKYGFERGQRMAKDFKEHGCKDLYDAYNAKFEGVVEAEWFECTDKCVHKWNYKCPCIQAFKDLGRTDEEIKEMAPLYCLNDIAIMTGFNPKLEVFPQPRLIMRGDSHCVYRFEDHGGA